MWIENSRWSKTFMLYKPLIVGGVVNLVWEHDIDEKMSSKENDWEDKRY